MDIDADKMLENALRDGLREAVKSAFSQGYDNPGKRLIAAAIEKHSPALQSLLGDALGSCLGDQQFREDIAAGVRHHMGKLLVQRFGGELEKAVNVLKSDPATRARITLAIEEIVKQKAQ